MLQVEFSTEPMHAGETRRLVLHGDGPFNVSATAILPQTWLQAYQPLGEMTPPKDVVDVTADQSFWNSRSGILEIDVEDARGTHRRLFVDVHPSAGAPAESVPRQR